MSIRIKGLLSSIVTDTNETKGLTKVLKTIPWDEVDIKSILVEVNHIPEGKDFLTQYMKQNNYKLYKKLDIDYFFVKQYVLDLI
ncbi:hypothetical protein Avbf_17253 [Armadillidium vulgare]|nr:hypothetical protein Avbf_17253 [Armadillidium vulgare]